MKEMLYNTYLYLRMKKHGNYSHPRVYFWEETSYPQRLSDEVLTGFNYKHVPGRHLCSHRVSLRQGIASCDPRL